MNLVEIFQRRVVAHPERMALSAEGEALSYGELNERANQLAHLLLKNGIGSSSPVGVHVDRGSDAVVALLGVLKAGGCCVPLDPEYPTERLQLMLRDSGAAFLVTQERAKGRFGEHGPSEVVLNWSDASLADSPRDDPDASYAGSDLAYIIYTSGSTGEPKGVEIEQDALRDNATKTARLFGLAQDDVVFQFSSLSFASSIGQIFAPLVSGGRVVLKGRQYSAAQLVKYISDQGVTVLWLTPSMIRYLTQRDDASIARLGPPLRLLRSGGEALTMSLVRHWFAHSSVPLLNVYGPTEAVQDITACLMTEVPHVISIGRPIFDAETFVLDDSGETVPVGVAGGLFFTTPGMARGYLNRPDLTAERFEWRTVNGRRLRMYRTGDMARVLPDGGLDFLGRQDRQFKLRGYRVEPVEIEERLNAHSAVASSAVIVSAGAAGIERLVAYYVLREGTGPDDSELRNWCRQALPLHIVPSKYVRVDRLPLTQNGKLDQRALRELSAEVTPEA
ncbi:amino acid adenylation domain-containing protein [Micromonospora sp. WMMD980]|uniref:amino acid adenylation domain-containing protein n=1 Tax=Micromonospora sp. WMMD980 TaxID=3016088 RepID=UPI002416564B|nr:amino acid adenylation domain-containing protein [Micromonospora sp. WMMD980]MDG4803131.1 amino acid adenylation domain-containing protein [Micromonospora sp. WMMD980]